jgi:hypothetical protein
LGKKKNGDEKEISPEEEAQQELERTVAKEGYDVKDNLLFLREYGADDRYCGMIFAYAVIQSRDHRVSVLPDDVPQRAIEKKLSRFQKSVREYLSQMKVKLRFAEAKDTTQGEVLAELDDIDFEESLRKTAFLRERRTRGIENILYDLVLEEMPFDMINAAVFAGAKAYRKKKGPMEHFYLEARYIQESLENHLEEWRGNKDE